MTQKEKIKQLEELVSSLTARLASLESRLASLERAPYPTPTEGPSFPPYRQFWVHDISPGTWTLSPNLCVGSGSHFQ